MKLKHNNSIRIKISLMVIGFTVVIVAASWLICGYILGNVFIFNVKSNLKATFESCNNLFQGTVDMTRANGDIFGQIHNPQDAVVMIVDDANGRIYTSINDEGKLMEGMNRLMDDVKNVESADQLLPGECIIRKTHDAVMNADYYDLIGLLDNGFRVLLRTPVSRIQAVMHVVTTVFVYICIGLIIFGSVFILLLSNIFATPIKRMSKAAKRMSQLDFDVRIPVTTNDEIGELGQSMNEMSDKLERTISELKTANLQLQKDIQKREKLDDMRTEFLSHVSHELKTPIALIQGYAEGLKDNLFDDEESRNYYTDVIIDEAGKMNTMVKRLLELNE
ncbi:MAG: histidine kinase dimerization/phospho-acceptor domain-containing protein, partial [Wujia sp.]